MKTKTLIFSFLIFFAIDLSAQKNDINKSKRIKSEFIESDKGIANYFSTAYGYVIFPGIGKGGLVIGGAGGKGTVFKKGAAVADCSMSQVTIGFPAGGQKYSEVIFFKNADTNNRFVNEKYEFAAQVSAIALTAGVSADAEYTDGILVFTQAIGGLMYEATVGGQKFETEMFK